MKIIYGLFFLACLLFLTSCDRRISDGQADELAQSRSDYVASLDAGSPQVRYNLLMAAGARMHAAIANIELPAPAVTPEQFGGPHGAELIEKETRDAQKAKEHPPEGSTNYTAIGGGALAVAALAVRLGLLGPIGGMVLDMLTPPAARKRREEGEKMRDAATAAVAYGYRVYRLATAAGVSLETVKSDEAEAQGKETQKIIDALLDAEKLKQIKSEMRQV